LSKQTNNIVANKICVVSKIGLGTGIFGKMAVKGLRHLTHDSEVAGSTPSLSTFK